MSRRGSVAVLGAGIMGAATALGLARRGVTVTLFDRKPAPMAGASRWNEGKIHLGFLYSADPTLATVRSVLDGGLRFADEVEELLGCSLRRHVTAGHDLYLVHRESVVPADDMGSYFERTAAMVRAHPRADRYLVDVSNCKIEWIRGDELEALADPASIVAGFRVPERSVDTNFVAGAFARAIEGEPAIELVCDSIVTAVVPTADDRWLVRCGEEPHGPFRAVVNALWEGRPAIDRGLGHVPDTDGQHRYRVAVFGHGRRQSEVPSAVVCAGPFGDVKCYPDGSFYVSWYPAGLLALGESAEPPPIPVLDAEDRRRIAQETFAGLGRALPWLEELKKGATEMRVRGGWVYSQGRGNLDDPAAGVHRRSRHGISRRGSYFSVDTGKYSVAPARAAKLAATVAGAVAR